MSHLDDLINLFDGQRARRQEAERAEAQQQRLDMIALADSPGWRRLETHLTSAIDLLHIKYDEGEELDPQERAFLRLARRIREGPQFLVEDADAIIAQTNRGNGWAK